MDRGDDDVELGEAVVGEIERAVGEDVALDAGEQRQALEAAVQRADPGRVCERARLVEAVGHRQRLAVIGDRDVLEAEPVRRCGHRLEVVLAVRRGRVHVQVAAQVGQRDERGQRPRAAPPRFRRGSRAARARPTPCRAPGRCLPPSRRRLAVVVHTEEAVLVQLEAALDGAVAHDDVVRLGAR